MQLILTITLILLCMSRNYCQHRRNSINDGPIITRNNDGRGNDGRVNDYRSIGLGDYKFANGNLSFDGIWIYKSRLRWVDLTKVDQADRLCKVNYEAFDKCTDDFHNVKVLQQQQLLLR